MVEMRFEIRFAAADLASASVDATAANEVEQQAELVAFARYAAQIAVLLGPDRAFALVRGLAALKDAGRQDAAALVEARGLRVLPEGESLVAETALRAVATFLTPAGGPRMYFRLRPHKLSPVADASVVVLLETLLRRRPRDETFARRLTDTAALIGRVGLAGELRPENEFDVSLAAADVAWRRSADQERGTVWAGERCPRCGSDNESAGFERRLWPSDDAAIHKCRRCGAGLWLRESNPPRLLHDGVWAAMEEMRSELERSASDDGGAAGSDDGAGSLLAELKHVFAENHWPYAEVRGVPVLLSELSGEGGSWAFYAQAAEDKGLVLLYSICPVRAPEARRPELAEFLTRANYGLAAGNFELDLEDGEVRYKTVLQLHGHGLDGITLKRVVRANGTAMETYLPAIRAVIDGESAQAATGRLDGV
jgi:hypothetical protein